MHNLGLKETSSSSKSADLQRGGGKGRKGVTRAEVHFRFQHFAT